jgi:hypothetical protein
MFEKVDPLVVEEFKRLIDSKEPEQRYQEFLEAHTEFLPREFEQNHGIHLDLVMRKLGLGGDYATDFFYLSKSSEDWHCVLIEIEKPWSRYFKDNSNDLHQDFSAALQQIDKWRAWLGDRANAQHFTDTVVGSLRRPLGENPCFFKYVLVHGRRGEIAGNKVRQSIVRAKEREDFKILSYDSLLDHPKYSRLYVGVRKNEYVDIVSKEFLSDSIFVHVPPSILRITRALRDDAIARRNRWFTHKDLNGLWMEDALKSVIVRE